MKVTHINKKNVGTVNPLLNTEWKEPTVHEKSIIMNLNKQIIMKQGSNELFDADDYNKIFFI